MSKQENHYAVDDVISYREMCDAEAVQTLQRGMNFRLRPTHSVILMSQRANAPYADRVYDDGITLEYEGHDIARTKEVLNPKIIDQPRMLPSGGPTQNGKFVAAIERFKRGESSPEPVRVYENIKPGIWSFKGVFNLLDYRVINDGLRNVYRFILQLSRDQRLQPGEVELAHTRIIPSEVKQAVWRRDKGKCVLCGAAKNLHFDHDLPFSRGGTSLTAENVRLLCMKCNLQKSNKIE